MGQIEIGENDNATSLFEKFFHEFLSPIEQIIKANGLYKNPREEFAQILYATGNLLNDIVDQFGDDVIIRIELFASPDFRKGVLNFIPLSKTREPLLSNLEKIEIIFPVNRDAAGMPNLN